MNKNDQVTIREQKVSDAPRFFEILSSPNFIHFSAKPKSLEEEIKFLEQNILKKENNQEYNFAILFNNILVGGIGLKIDQKRSYIAEAGYFIDENYWGNNIASSALKLLEAFAFDKHLVKRIELKIVTLNRSSEKVAIKCGYDKEGTAKQMLLINDKYYDCYLYAKINKKRH